MELWQKCVEYCENMTLAKMTVTKFPTRDGHQRLCTLTHILSGRKLSSSEGNQAAHR